MSAASPWRIFCALSAGAILLQLALLTGAGEARHVAVEIAVGDTLPLMLAAFAACIAAAVHARSGWRDTAALTAAIAAGAAAGAYATWAQMSGFSDRLSIGQSAWKGVAVLALVLPPALLWARRAHRLALLALAGAALAVVGLSLASPRAVAFDSGRALVGVVPFFAGSATVAGALAREAWSPHPAPPRPFPPWVFAGPLFLLLAWGFGGSFLVVVPLWIVAPILLAMPALARWRRRPTAALVASALLLAGALVPAGSCAFPNISDVVRPDEPRAALEEVRLWEAGGHGPFWVRADLMGSGSVLCSSGTVLLGGAWLAALAAVAWARWPEPQAIVRRLTATSTGN